MRNPFKKKISEEQHIFESLLIRRTCPDCGSKKFYQGPSGGASTNYKCVGCGSKFNVAPFFAERIKS
jgi:DNA-directed RNA polymerase subunit RPC12/RpoP